MGLKDSLKGFFSKSAEQKEEQAEPKKVTKPAKYPDEVCALCGKPGCDIKWAGQYWHKKCLRSMRKGARSMI